MYCTQDDIIKSGIPEDDLIQLTDNNDLDAVDSDVVDSVIAQQDELIDGYLRSRYSLPLDPVPGVLNGLAVALCCQALYRLRPHMDMPDSIKDAANDARKELGKIQSGTIRLNVDQVAEVSSEGSHVVAPARIFSDDLLDRY